MQRLVLHVIIIASLIISSCSVEQRVEKKKPKSKIAKGGKVYGGEISFYTTEKVNTFFPLSSISMYNQRAIAPVFETLLIFDEETQSLLGNLATSFEVSDDQETIDFTIRKDVYFHNDPCFNGKHEQLTAKDIKFSLDLACSPHKLNQHSQLFLGKIEGAMEFYNDFDETMSKGVSGIQVLSDFSLRIKLKRRSPTFLKILTHQNIAVFSKKAFLFYQDEIEKHPVGTGPFKLKSYNNGGLLYVKNDRYWRKDEFNNRLPFLNKIHVLFNKQSDEFESFTSQKTDLLLSVPSNEVNSLFGTLDEAKKGKNILHKLQYRKGVKVNYIAFDCSRPPFNDVNLRRAIYHGIDRNRICEETLLGEGTPAEKGLLPQGYYKETKENWMPAFNLDLARNYMNKSNYSGEALDFFANYSSGTLDEDWCLEIIKQLKNNIGLNLNLIKGSYKEKVKAIERGDVAIWKGGYIPDYPDAESFLNSYYSKNIGVNALWSRGKYTSSDFDRAFEKSSMPSSDSLRNIVFNSCVKTLKEDAPIVPVYFENLLVVYNLNLRDANINSFGIIDFSKAYYKRIK